MADKVYTVAILNDPTYSIITGQKYAEEVRFGYKPYLDEYLDELRKSPNYKNVKIEIWVTESKMVAEGLPSEVNV